MKKEEIEKLKEKEKGTNNECLKTSIREKIKDIDSKKPITK